MGRGQGRRVSRARRCTTSRMPLCRPTQSTTTRRGPGTKRTAYRAAARGQGEIRLGRVGAATAIGSTEGTDYCQTDRHGTNLDDQPEDWRCVVHAQWEGFGHRPRTHCDRSQPGGSGNCLRVGDGRPKIWIANCLYRNRSMEADGHNDCGQSAAADEGWGHPAGAGKRTVGIHGLPPFARKKAKDGAPSFEGRLTFRETEGAPPAR